jgi:hypothetical protein
MIAANVVNKPRTLSIKIIKSVSVQVINNKNYPVKNEQILITNNTVFILLFVLINIFFIYR